MGFEKFDSRNGYWGMREDIPSASLWPKPAVINLNAKAIKEFHFTAGSRCDLYYDKDKQIIGIKPTRNQIQGTLLRTPKSRRGKNFVYFGARRFMTHFGVPLPSKRTRYPLTKGRDGMIHLQLKDGKPSTIGRPPK